MIHKQLIIVLMTTYPVQYFLLAVVVVVATIGLTIHAKNKGEER